MVPMNKALCIGVSDYGSPEDDLPGVANDVAAVAALLSGDGGAFGGGTRIILDSAATRERVLAELEAVFVADPADTVFVYLAGHGTAEGDRYYFVPRDVGGGTAEDWAVPLMRVRELFEACPARRALLFLDCCHSGGVIARRHSVTAGSRELQDRPREALKRAIRIEGGEGKMIYAACTERQLSYESVALRYGFFTHAMVEGIRGKAANVRGEVTANGLFDHIAQEVERAGGDRQQPMQYGHMTGRLVLVYDAARASAALGPPAEMGPVGAESSPTARVGTTIDDSGALVMLGDAFFDDAQVRADGDDLTIVVPSPGAAVDAEVEELRPIHGSRVVAFAHLNDGGNVRVRDVRSASEGGRQVWTITSRREQGGGGAADFSYNAGGRTYSPLDFAVMKARRVLLGERTEHEPYRPGMGRPAAMLNPLAFGGRDEGKLLDQCPLRDLAAARQSGDAEVPVAFRGRRSRAYTNVEPEVVEVEGMFRR